MSRQTFGIVLALVVAYAGFMTWLHYREVALYGLGVALIYDVAHLFA